MNNEINITYCQNRPIWQKVVGVVKYYSRGGSIIKMGGVQQSVKRNLGIWQFILEAVTSARKSARVAWAMPKSAWREKPIASNIGHAGWRSAWRQLHEK